MKQEIITLSNSFESWHEAFSLEMPENGFVTVRLKLTNRYTGNIEHCKVDLQEREFIGIFRPILVRNTINNWFY